MHNFAKCVCGLRQMQPPPSKSNEATLGGLAAEGDQPDERQQRGDSPNGPPPRPPPPYVADPAQRPQDQGYGPEQEGLSIGVEDAILDLAPHQNQSAPPARSDSSPEPSEEKVKSTGARPKAKSSGELQSDSPISSPSPAHREESTGAARTTSLSSPAGIGQVDSEVSFNLRYFVNPGKLSFPSPRAVHFSDKFHY